MTAAWTVRDHDGQLLADFAAGSRLDVGRKVVPAHYDAFRLQVSPSYRQLFDRALAEILKRRGWEIVRIGACTGGLRAAPASGVVAAGH